MNNDSKSILKNIKARLIASYSINKSKKLKIINTLRTKRQILSC